MKTKKLLLSILIAGCASGVIMSQTPAKQTEAKTKSEPKPANTERVTVMVLKTSMTSRPKAPSRQVIECDYDGAYLTFSFTVPAGECEAAVTEWYSGATQTYTIDSSDLTAAVYVGQLYESTVTLTTAAGTTYAADLTAN